MTTPARVAVAALVGVLLVGAAAYYFTGPGQPAVGVPGPSPVATASPNASAVPTSSAAGRPTDYAGLDGWIVFEHFGQAPDGSTTTFDPNRRQIWLVHADGSNLHELAPGNPVGKASPDISPDGSKVIFHAGEDPTQIWEASIEGGQPVLVSTDCAATACLEHDPTYSPDGKRVAFMRAEDTGSSGSSVIGVRDLETNQVTLLETTRVLLTTGDLAQPTWSPDGLQIAYHHNTQTPTDERPTKIRIEIVNVDGTGLRELPAPAGEAKAGDPDWSPDGSLIVFSTMPNREGEGDGNGSTGIFTIHPDGTGLTDVCGTCLQGGIAPSWTPDGQHILFWGFRTWALMDPDGANAAHINSSELTWFGEELGYGYLGLLQPTP